MGRQVECPRCESDEVEVVDANYPEAYECKKCKHNFVRGKQALIDE